MLRKRIIEAFNKDQNSKNKQLGRREILEQIET